MRKRYVVRCGRARPRYAATYQEALALVSLYHARHKECCTMDREKGR